MCQDDFLRQQLVPYLPILHTPWRFTQPGRIYQDHLVEKLRLPDGRSSGSERAFLVKVLNHLSQAELLVQILD
jgi:hypothetical protein